MEAGERHLGSGGRTPPARPLAERTRMACPSWVMVVALLEDEPPVGSGRHSARRAVRAASDGRQRVAWPARSRAPRQPEGRGGGCGSPRAACGNAPGPPWTLRVPWIAGRARLSSTHSVMTISCWPAVKRAVTPWHGRTLLVEIGSAARVSTAEDSWPARLRGGTRGRMVSPRVGRLARVEPEGGAAVSSGYVTRMRGSAALVTMVCAEAFPWEVNQLTWLPSWMEKSCSMALTGSCRRFARGGRLGEGRGKGQDERERQPQEEGRAWARWWSR